MLFQSISKCFYSIVMFLFLASCGGGGGDSGIEIIDQPVRKDVVEGQNLALSRQGSIAMSTFRGNESFVIDGVLDKNNFWSPGADGDSITVELKDISIVKNITIDFSGNFFRSGDFVVDISEDGITFNELTINDCLIHRSSTSYYSCELLELPVKFLRLTIPDITRVFNIHEIQIRDEFSSRNVALSIEGGSVTSSNVGEMDMFVIDGIVGDDNAWSPTIIGDFLTIELDRLYEIYTVYVDYSSSATAPFELSVSEDGLDFTVQELFNDCSTLRIGKNILSCGLTRVDGDRTALGREIRYIRLTALGPIDNFKINEVRAHKKPKLFCPLNFSSCPDVQVVDEL